MATHTPIPWRADPLVGTHLLGPNDRPIATTGGYTTNTVPDNGRAENEANAALIIRAVNSHEALRAAAQAVLTDWHAHPRNMQRKEPPYLEVLRAAIKLVEEA